MARKLTIDGHAVKIRHPLAPLGLGLVTLGIYTLYWYFQINREIRDLGESVRPGVSLLAITFGVFLIVPPFVSVFNTAERIRRVQERFGVSAPISSVLALVMLFIPFVNVLQSAYVQSHVNRAYEARERSAAAPSPT